MELSVLQQDIRPDDSSSSYLGLKGEKLAADHLESQGYRLVVSNFRVPVGRNSRGVQVTGEIDIVALDADVLCFIEVKTRRSAEFGGPLTAVDLRKQRQITRTARAYRRIFRVFEMDHRFDVVTVLIERGSSPKIELVKGYWSESRFRKQYWSGDIF